MQQLHCENVGVSDIHFNLLEAAGISPVLAQNENAKTKERGGWALSKYECYRLRRMFTQVGAAFWPVRSLVNAGNLQNPK